MPGRSASGAPSQVREVARRSRNETDGRVTRVFGGMLACAAPRRLIRSAPDAPLLAFLCFFRVLFGRTLPARLRSSCRRREPEEAAAARGDRRLAEKVVEKVVEKPRRRRRDHAAASRRRARAARAAPARRPVRRLRARLGRRRERCRHRRGRARGPSRLPQGARSAPVARAGDAGSGGREGRGAEGLRSGGGPPDRRGEGRAAVRGTLRHHGWRVVDAKLPDARRRRRSRGDRARGGGAARMMRILGIDLGTTNSALARRPATTSPRTSLGIAQVVGPGEIAERADPALVPAAAERARGRARAAAAAVVGPAALRGRHVRARARRRAAAPAGVVGEVVAVQPVDRSHRAGAAVPRRAARARRGDGRRRARVAGQRIGALPRAPARRVGRRAPRRAGRRAGSARHRAGELRSGRARADRASRRARPGFEKITLLEEPQAAFYAYLAARGDAWRKDLKPGDVVLVCDVGGGTTDFSLIEVARGRRRARARARSRSAITSCSAATTWTSRSSAIVQRDLGKQLDALQQRALVHACRRAKEQLLGADAPESRAGRDPRPRQQADRRHDQGRGHARAGRGAARRRLLPDGRRRREAPSAAAPAACARWACPTRTIRRSRATSPSSSAGSAACRPRCCSTAA